MEFLIPLLIGLGTSLFGGKGQTYQQKATTTQTSSPRGYQDPTLALISSALGSGLLGNVQRLGGAGYPSGMSNPGMGNYQGIIEALMAMQPDLIAGTKTPAKKEKTQGEKASADKKAMACVDACSKRFMTNGPPQFAAFEACRNKCVADAKAN